MLCHRVLYHWNIWVIPGFCFQTPLQEFWESFEHHLKYSMIIFKREPVVERTIEFAAKFATSFVKEEDTEKPVKESLEEDDEEEEMHPFLLNFFTFLLKVGHLYFSILPLAIIDTWIVVLWIYM